jgi:hypothetical protein
MSNGWKEVARLGSTGARYPHVLVDSHGWCLRLGPKSRSDEKYFSSLPSLLQGILEHSSRRHLTQVGSLDLPGLVREVRAALDSALTLCSEMLKNGGPEAHIRLSSGLKGDGTAGSPNGLRLIRRTGEQAESDRQVPRTAI